MFGSKAIGTRPDTTIDGMTVTGHADLTRRRGGWHPVTTEVVISRDIGQAGGAGWNMTTTGIATTVAGTTIGKAP